MRSQRAVGVVVGLLSVLAPAARGSAEPLWDRACDDVPSTYKHMQSTRASTLHVYVADRFAESLRECTPSLDDDAELTEFHARQQVKEAAEVWNAEARGVVLRYAGVFRGDPEDACVQGEAPSIYVNFVRGCLRTGGSCDTSGVAGVHALANPTCPNAMVLEVYGDRNDLDGCGGTARNGWTFDESRLGGLSLRGVLVHELGHALGLDHPDANGVADVECDTFGVTSVMCQAVSIAHWHYAHLWPWEKDCVDQRWGGRQTIARAQTFASSGDLVADGVIAADITTKGSRSGYAWKQAGVAEFPYSMMVSTGAWISSPVGADGQLWWAWGDYDWTSEAVDVAMLFTNVNPAAAYGAHVFYNWNPTRAQDPPVVGALESASAWEDAVPGPLHAYSAITDSFYPVVSHIPVTTAFDPRSQQTVFVAVDTARGGRSATQGGIVVYPGIRKGFRFLREGEYLHANVHVPPDGYEAWDHELRTYFAPGVSCAPESVRGFNCVLAWVDRGTPDNQVLHTWFRIEGGSVEWQGQAWPVDSAFSFSHVSVGYFGGLFRLSFKDGASSNGHRTATHALDDRAAWTFPELYVSQYGYVADPPVWAAIGDHSEAALLWTESR